MLACLARRHKFYSHFFFFWTRWLGWFVSSAPQVSPKPAFWRNGGPENWSQHVHEDPFGPGIFSWGVALIASCLPPPASSLLLWQESLPWNATSSSQHHTRRAIATSQGKLEQPQGCLMACLPSPVCPPQCRKNRRRKGDLKASL